MDNFQDEKIGMHELKQRAKAYYATGDGDGVLKKMEEVLNAMFYDKPEDVFGHLVRTSVVVMHRHAVIYLYCSVWHRSHKVSTLTLKEIKIIGSVYKSGTAHTIPVTACHCMSLHERKLQGWLSEVRALRV